MSEWMSDEEATALIVKETGLDPSCFRIVRKKEVDEGDDFTTVELRIEPTPLVLPPDG